MALAFVPSLAVKPLGAVMLALQMVDVTAQVPEEQLAVPPPVAPVEELVTAKELPLAVVPTLAAQKLLAPHLRVVAAQVGGV